MKRWIYHQNVDDARCKELGDELHIDPKLASVLINRGINSYAKAKQYFRPKLEDLHDPFLMKDMDIAVSCLEKHISEQNKILIYGDYDVDGTTSVSLLYQFLKSFTDKIEYYIPDRYSEGYGVSKQGIDYAIKNQFSLIITLDCGIRAIENINHAAENKIDVIICDHHLPGEVLPKAKAILDPKQKGDTYPFKELSGCGVGFKLVSAYAQKNGIEFFKIKPLLDLVAVSIAADIVPIIDENRILMYFGLAQLNRGPRSGIESLLRVAGVNKQIDVNDIVFGVAPRINAAGRIKHAGQAVDLLISTDEDQCLNLSREINSLNEERRSLDETITREAIDIIEEEQDFHLKKSTVLFKNSWHKGVVGIVASRVIENYFKPTIILAESSGEATGSARTVADFNIYEAIHECKDLLTKYGGHKHAAGLTLPIENVEPFKKKFEEVVSQRINNEQLTPTLFVDTKLRLNKIDHKFYSIIKQMEPFGPGNMSPVFTSNQVTCSSARIIGSKHLKLIVHQDGSRKLEAIGFGFGKYLDQIRTDTPISIAYTIGDNHYNGVNSIQLIIKDIKS